MADNDTPKDAQDPAAGLAERYRQVLELRAQADSQEGEVVLAALEAAGWLEARAAAYLGIPRQTFQYLIGPKGRHPELGKRAAQRRAKKGYTTGRPPF